MYILGILFKLRKMLDMEREKTVWVSVMIALSILVTHSSAIKMITKGAKVVVLNDQGFFTSSNVSFKVQTCRQVDILLATTRRNVEKRADFTFRINVGVSQSDKKTTVLYSRKPQMTLLQEWSLCNRPVWLTVTTYQGHLTIARSCNSRNIFKYQMDTNAPIKYAGISSSGEAAWEIATIPDCTKPANVEKPNVKNSGFFQLRSLRLKTKGLSKLLGDYGFIRERAQSLQLKVRGCDVAVVILCKTRRISISETYTISLNERHVRANKTITVVRRCENRKCSTLGILAPNGPLDICKQATTFYLTVSKGVFSVAYKCDSKSGKSWKADNLDLPFIGIYSKSKQKAIDWIVMKSRCMASYTLSAPPPKMTKLMTLGNNNVIYLKDKGIPASSSLVFQLQTCSHADLQLATTDAKLRSRNAEYTLRLNDGQAWKRETFLYADGSEPHMTLQQSRSLCQKPASLMLTFHDGNLTISERCSPHKFRWPMDANNTIMHVGVLSDTKAVWLIANVTKCPRKGSRNKRRNGSKTKQGLFKLRSIHLKPNSHGRELNEHGFDLFHTTSLQFRLTTCDVTTILISKPGAALVNVTYKIVINEYNKAINRRLTDIHQCKAFECESVFKETPNMSAQHCTQTITYFLGLQEDVLAFGYSCEYEAGRSWRIKNPFDEVSIRLESQGQNQKRPWKITANDCITNNATRKRDGLDVDISKVVRKEHRNKSSDTKDIHINLAMNQTEVTNSPQAQEKFIGESSTRQVMPSLVRYDSSTDGYELSVRYDASTVRYDASTTRYNSSTGRNDASTGTYDAFTGRNYASTARYDPSSGGYEASSGRYDASTTRYDSSTGRYDSSTRGYDDFTGRNDVSTARYDPSSGVYDASTGRNDASTGRYDASSGRYDASTGRYDASREENPRLQEKAKPTAGKQKQVDGVPSGLKSNKSTDYETNVREQTSPPLPVDSSILEQTSATGNHKYFNNESNMQDVENKSSNNYKMTEYKSYSMPKTVPYVTSDVRTQGFKEATTRIPDNVKRSETSEPADTSHTSDGPDRRKLSSSSRVGKSTSQSLHHSLNTSSVVTNTTGDIPNVDTLTKEQRHTFKKDTSPGDSALTNKNSFEKSSTEQRRITDKLTKLAGLLNMNKRKGGDSLQATAQLFTHKIIPEDIFAESKRSKSILTMQGTQSLTPSVNVKPSVDSPTFEPGMATESSMNTVSVLKPPAMNADVEKIVTSSPNTEPDSEIRLRENVTSVVKSPSRNVGWERNATLSVSPSTTKPDSEIRSKKNVTSPSVNPDLIRTGTGRVFLRTVGATTETGAKANVSHLVKASSSVNDTIQGTANENISTMSSMDAVADELTEHHTNPAAVKYKTEFHSQISKSNSSAEGPSVPRGKEEVTNPEYGDDKDAELLTSPGTSSVSDIFAPGAGVKAASGTTLSPSSQADTNVTRNEQREREGPPHRNTTMIQGINQKSPRSDGCDICVNVFIMSVLIIHL